jgi:integrase
MATIPLTDSGLKKKINDCEKVIAGGGEAKANIADGGGLTLQRQPSGAWLWFYRYRFGGKPSRLSLGAYPTVTLAQARETHRAAKDTLAQGINPSQERKETKLKQAVAIQNDFKSVARAWWDSWRGDKTAAHAAKVWANLEKDVFTVMGNRAVDSIKPAIIRLAVQGVVKRGALDTAARVHQYIRSVLNYAVAHELIEANPAIGLLLNDIIPKRKTKNQERIDLKELPQLLRDMDAYDGHVLTRYALQLINMTFVRTKELIEAEWSEIDLVAGVWTIAPHRMKMKTIHLVPLSRQAVALLVQLRAITGGQRYLFPSIKGDGKTMSNNTILYALYRMGYRGRMTGHGYRGVASTALNEQGYDERHIELQLAHLTGNATQRAYDHAKHMIERTKMMQAWADYLDEQRGVGKVIKMKAVN